MGVKQLPTAYRFNSAYLEGYIPGMELPEFDYTPSGVVIEKQHPLTRFLAFYFRLIIEPSSLTMNAFRESSLSELLLGKIVSDEDGSLRAEVKGSIDLLQAYRDEVANTREYAIKRGWPDNKWPIDSLKSIVEELDGNLSRIKTPRESTTLEL